MSIKFTDLQGKATKSGPERYKPEFGQNTVRIVGTVVPSYKYWLKKRDGTSVTQTSPGINTAVQTGQGTLAISAS